MAKKELTYAEAMAEIEKILERLRNEEMNVDGLAAEVKRATASSSKYSFGALMDAFSSSMASKSGSHRRGSGYPP